jgi:hypothetical protein
MQRLPELLDERIEFLPVLRSNAANPQRDANGSSSASLANSLRFIGVAAYVVHGDAAKFRELLAESSSIRLRLFQRFDTGEPISESYVSMLSYKSLFNALAAGDFGLATDLAKRMGGRESIEQELDHLFDNGLGYTLKAFVLQDEAQMRVRADGLTAILAERANANFCGYGEMFDAILSRDSKKCTGGLRSLVQGHQRESRGSGVFRDSEDEVLSVWGLGMANLAVRFDLHVPGLPPLVPQDLLVGSKA